MANSDSIPTGSGDIDSTTDESEIGDPTVGDPTADDLTIDDPTGETVEEIADDVVSEIQHGQVDDDVSTILTERLDAAGLQVRPEDIDTLADEVENDASR